MKTTLSTAAHPDPVAVELQRPDPDDPTNLVAVIDGEAHEIDLAATGPTSGLIRLNNRISRYVTHREGDRILVWLDGQSYTFNVVDTAPKRSGAAAAGASGNLINAPMPGTILKILVDAGDSVQAHQPLIIMESMKMEMTLSAPADAVINDIHCTEGQLVERDATLVTLDRTE